MRLLPGRPPKVGGSGIGQKFCGNSIDFLNSRRIMMKMGPWKSQNLSIPIHFTASKYVPCSKAIPASLHDSPHCIKQQPQWILEIATWA